MNQFPLGNENHKAVIRGNKVLVCLLTKNPVKKVGTALGMKKALRNFSSTSYSPASIQSIKISRG